MAMIKLPQGAISFFKNNQDQIFQSGALAEGSWNNKVQDWICEYTSSNNSLATSSNGTGLLAVLQALKFGSGFEDIFLQSNTMYGMFTLANSSGLKLLSYVDCDINFLMPTYEQVNKYIKKL